MPYICNVSPDLILSIDGVEGQTHFVLTTTANGELRVRRSALAIGAWNTTPEVLRTPTATLLRFRTTSGSAYAQVYDEHVELLTNAPMLDDAVQLLVRIAPGAMAIATPPHTSAAAPVTQQLVPVAPAPPMPELPTPPAVPQRPAMPDAPTVDMPIASLAPRIPIPVAPNMPVPVAPAVPNMPTPIVPAAPIAPTVAAPAAPIAPTVAVPAAPSMPVPAAPIVALPATSETLWDTRATANPPQERSEQVRDVLQSAAARRVHPLWPLMLWGGITVLMVVLGIVDVLLVALHAISIALLLATLLSVVWWFVHGLQSFIPLINRWRARMMRKAAGERGSSRETIVFSVGIGLLIFVCACAPFSAVSSAVAHPNPLQFQSELMIYLIICVALAYSLLGTIVNWRETGDVASSHLLDNLSQCTDEVYASLIERMAERQLPRPYKAEFVEYEEQGLYSFEYQTVRQLNISYGRARVIFRASARGTDMYVRWESYMDFSMRRVAYVASLLSQIFIAPLEAVSRNSLVELIATLFFSARDSTGGREISADTIPLGNLLLSLNWNYIPSYAIDELQALEVAVTRSAEEVLNRLTVELGREERIHLAIDRSKSRYQRLF